MSKPKAHNESLSDFKDPDRGPLFSVRFLVSLLLMTLGIAWIVYYYTVVRVDPGLTPAPEPGNPRFMADLEIWNYAIGFGLVMIGLTVAAHPKTPLGRGRGVVVTMLACFIVGLLWIVAFYLFANDISDIPVLNDLGNYNLVVGIALMGVGFAYATHWE